MTQDPPKIFSKILRQVIHPLDRESLEGDFEEMFCRVKKESGTGHALIWYLCHIFKLIPTFVTDSIYWSVAMFNNYLKIAFRNIYRHKGYSAINIFGLATGMACCILIMLWVADELGYDRFHKNIDDLHRIVVQYNDGWGSSAPWALAPILKEEYPEIIKATRFRGRSTLVSGRDKNYNETVALADPDFFEMFTFSLIKGEKETLFNSLNSIVITEQLAIKFFEGEEAVGQVLSLNNSREMIVTGVIENIPPNSSLQFDCLVPVQILGEGKLSTWAVESSTFIQLQNNTSPEVLREKIVGVIAKYDTRTDMKKNTGIQPYSEMYLYGLNGTGPILYVYIFSAIALIILLIACINFMNLATARSSTRAKEIGMRKVVGAEKKDIIKQFFGEAILSSVIALLFAVFIVYMFLPAFNTLAAKQLSLDLIGSYTSVIGLFGIAVLTGIIAGSYPAIFLASFIPVKILKGSLRSGAKSTILRKFLVIAQFTTTIALIIGTMLLYNQLNFIRNKDLGFNKDQVVVISMNNDLRSGYDSFKNELLQNAGIVNVSSATSLPTSVGNFNPVYWEGKGPDDYVGMNFAGIDLDYFETFEMQFAEGRSFSREYATDGENYVLNEAAAKLTGLESPIGKMFSIWTREGKIIGVVKDFHSKSLHSTIAPIVFTFTTNWRQSRAFVKVKPENIQGTLGIIEDIFLKHSPGYPFEYTFLDEQFGLQYRTDQRIGEIFKYFTILAVFISCLGLLGLASFTAEQRTKEIGIRKVLGASISSIVMMISKEFIILIALANIIAWPAAYYGMDKLLSYYAYRTGISIWVFFAAAGLALVTAFITVGLQTLKAARSNPVDSIRYE